MMKPPVLQRQQPRGGDDGYAIKATHLWLWNKDSDNGSEKDAPKKLSHYQGNGEGSQKGCTDKALALMKGCTEEALALMITGRRQWQRESERCTDDALALMSGCADEALALMAARRRQ
nr:hypothetical protein CFP56_57111 [Quercus suber]